MSAETKARQLVVFTLAGEQYALPIKQVQEIIRYSPPRSAASSDYSVHGVLSLRGRIIPVCDLAARLAVSSELGEHTKIVIVETGAQTIGVIVDAVDEVLTVEEQQIEPAPAADARLIDAIARIGERLVVLLTPSTILSGLEAAAV